MLLVICFCRFERIVLGTLLGELFFFVSPILMLVMLYCCWRCASFEIYFLVLSVRNSFFILGCSLDSLEDYDSVILCYELLTLIREFWEVLSSFFFLFDDLWLLYYLINGLWLFTFLCEGLLLLGVDNKSTLSSLILSWELVIKDWLKLRLLLTKSSFIIYFSFAPPKVSYDWLFSSVSLYLTLSDGVGFIPADCFLSAIFGMECNLENMPINKLGKYISTFFNEVL